MTSYTSGTPTQNRTAPQSIGFLLLDNFTPDELIWECMEQTTCECGCIRFLWAPGWVPFDKNILHEPNLARASRADLTASWHQIVEQYSRLDLSFSRDKLPAIAGAAKVFSGYRKSRYYVGLWRDSFVKDMMWVRNGRLEDTSVPCPV